MTMQEQCRVCGESKDLAYFELVLRSYGPSDIGKTTFLDAVLSEEEILLCEGCNDRIERELCKNWEESIRCFSQ